MKAFQKRPDAFGRLRAASPAPHHPAPRAARRQPRCAPGTQQGSQAPAATPASASARWARAAGGCAPCPGPPGVPRQGGPRTRGVPPGPPAQAGAAGAQTGPQSLFKTRKRAAGRACLCQPGNDGGGAGAARGSHVTRRRAAGRARGAAGPGGATTGARGGAPTPTPAPAPPRTPGPSPSRHDGAGGPGVRLRFSLRV